MSAGKGDKPRPVDKKKFDKNYENIQWPTKNNEKVEQKHKHGKTIFIYK